MLVKELIIPIVDSVDLHIYSSTTDQLYEVDNAIEHGESKWQLVEGKEYDFEITEEGADAYSWTIEGTDSIFTINKKHNNRGKIKTGIYVGTVNFIARNKINEQGINLQLEVQSEKLNYKKHYRTMLEDITKYYTDLVMQQGSPITQKFEVDYDTPQKTLYQKFSFVKSIVLSESFDESIHKIVGNPVRKWTETQSEKRIESVKRLTRNSMRQVTTRSDRIRVHNVHGGLSSLPRTLLVPQKTDTTDTHENQFIKYVLTSLYGFCSNLRTKKHATDQLKKEVDIVCEKISEHLNNSFFKQISRPSRLNIGSPILQRKEGYREILQSWLMFDLAAKLTWEGGDTVYEAGKKNVAVLYEYWIFFKLMNIVNDLFKLTEKSTDKLVQLDSDSINLNIKHGRTTVIEGKYEEGNRLLNIRLFYNRTFSSVSEINKAGSWTMSMRPDYTLTIWPGDLSEVQAEENNTIVHIHFDAKYRLDKIIIDDSNKNVTDINSDLDCEKTNNEINIYKRGDLLKMHAYKDAIRRTGGAYVLYPGDKPQKKVGFHEIIPGLGAFCISPNDENSQQIDELKKFIRDVVAHFMNRTSQREKIATYSNKIYNEPRKEFLESFPEIHEKGMFPDSTPVLIVSYNSQEHLDWITEQKKFPVCLGSMENGNLNYDSKITTAQYLLLYHSNTNEISGLYKVLEGNPKICTSDALNEMYYPQCAENHLYMMFDICPNSVEVELMQHRWSLGQFKIETGVPLVVNYISLFEEDPLKSYEPSDSIEQIESIK